mgnify:FL=1
MKLEKFKITNKKLKNIIFLSIYTIILITIVYFATSFAYYEEKKDFNVINGTVEDPGDIYFAYYIDGKISREMPSQNTGYTLDETKSNCTNGVKITWNHSTWHGETDYTNYNTTDNTRTKCTLYFNKTSKIVSTVLGNIEVNSYTPDFTKSACDDESCESHEKGIYETTDYDGNPTYYYRGSVENNYVKFAGYYWRIIRINSNGAVRMIYDGTTAHYNGESSEDRQFGISNFNTANNDNMYLGYMYTSGEAHGVGTSSAIKINVDKFYQDKLINYTSKIDSNSGFCGDRSALNLQANAGTGNIDTYYKSSLRIEESKPTLDCENMNDYYTISEATSGNKALTYPIGLISADEVMLAGHAGGIFNGTYTHTKKNKTSYLTTGNAFWTLTPASAHIPYGFSYWYAFGVVIGSSGIIDDNSAPFGIKPVININSNVSVTGTGTKTDPYIIN